jgi:hypothetical protein
VIDPTGGSAPDSSLLAGAVGLRLDREADALDAIASGLPGCIFIPADLHPNFFDLSNGLAGAVFQKFANYGFRAAFVLPVDHGFGARVAELAREHRTHPLIRLFTDADEAQRWLTG